MASIKKQGRGYLITVSAGTDIHGARIREYMTWVPPDGMTNRQAEKEVNRQAVLFEDKVKSGLLQDNNIRFAEFMDLWIKRHCKKKLKAKTVSEYEKLAPTIKQAMGHIKLRDLRPGHLNAFYDNLQEEGIRNDTKYVRCIDLDAELLKRKLTKSELHRLTGLSVYSVRSAVLGNAVEQKTAKLICDQLGIKLDKAFSAVNADDTLSSNTVRHYHSVISACLGKAVKWGYLESNPAANADPPQIIQEEAAYLDIEDAKKILNRLQEAPPKYRNAIIFDLLSGLRRGELLGLPWRNVDFGNEIIRINQALYYVKEHGLMLDTPKSEKSGRFLRLSRSAFAILREQQAWQQQQEQLLGDAWKNDKGFVFTNEEGNPIHPDTLTGWFADLCETAGYPDIHLHSLRHTYASLMITEGTPLVVVSKRMGHAQVSTTSNIYSHVISSADEKAAQVAEVFTDVLSSDSELFEENAENVIAIKKRACR